MLRVWAKNQLGMKKMNFEKIFNFSIINGNFQNSKTLNGKLSFDHFSPIF